MKNGLKISSHKLKDLYKLAINGDEDAKLFDKKYKAILNNKAKLMYNDHILLNSENKSKAAWKIINRNK